MQIPLRRLSSDMRLPKINRESANSSSIALILSSFFYRAGRRQAVHRYGCVTPQARKMVPDIGNMPAGSKKYSDERPFRCCRQSPFPCGHRPFYFRYVGRSERRGPFNRIEWAYTSVAMGNSTSYNKASSSAFTLSPMSRRRVQHRHQRAAGP